MQVDETEFAYKNSEMRTDKIKKRMARFKSTFTAIKRFSEILKCLQTMRASLSQYPRGLCDRFPRV